MSDLILAWGYLYSQGFKHWLVYDRDNYSRSIAVCPSREAAEAARRLLSGEAAAGLRREESST